MAFVTRSDFKPNLEKFEEVIEELKGLADSVEDDRVEDAIWDAVNKAYEVKHFFLEPLCQQIMHLSCVIDEPLITRKEVETLLETKHCLIETEQFFKENDDILQKISAAETGLIDGYIRGKKRMLP